MAAHNLRILENNPAAGARDDVPATGRYIVTDIYGSLRLRDLKAKSRPGSAWFLLGKGNKPAAKNRVLCMTEHSDVRVTRAAYNTVAADYAELLRNELDAKPFDRAMLGTFAELVESSGGGAVADLGCGPGRITAHLHSLGLAAFGVDLSPEMVVVARKDHPGLRFDEGSMEALELADGTLGGIVAWYSIIHTPPARLPAVFAEFHRTLLDGGLLLLAFQAGDEPRHLDFAYGHEIDLDAYRLPPERITELLLQAGFVVEAQLLREPDDRHEKTRQAYLLARKPATS
jgi:SAM-dependent methyltransferase